MNSPKRNLPICYRLIPDRQLLDEKGEVSGSELPVLATGRRMAGRAMYDVPPCLLGLQHHTVLAHDGIRRLALMVTSEEVGSEFRDQVWEVMSTMRAILRQQPEPMVITTATVFINDSANIPIVQALFDAYFGDQMPLTRFVKQPPCDGRGLAVEAWAISTQGAKVEFVDKSLVTVEYEGIRWIYAGAGAVEDGDGSAYDQSAEVLADLSSTLEKAGASFHDVVRTWFYQGGITEMDGDQERYQELNRARTDFFAHIPFHSRRLMAPNIAHSVYPASTGIGTLGKSLVAGCMALQTDREDMQLLPLENPLQTPSFDYPESYSPKTPKFSRAMALRIGDAVTTWVSGTASIVNAETVFPDDIEKQTDQTLTNIEQLIARENFENQGWKGAGATLRELAKVRVYVKRPEDYEKCREVCERRLGSTPVIYAQADVCRADLLVEIEGVAFSTLQKAPLTKEKEKSLCESASLSSV